VASCCTAKIRVHESAVFYLGPAALLKQTLSSTARRRTIEKIPWSVLPFGRDAEASEPGGMLTQWVIGSQRRGGGLAVHCRTASNSGGSQGFIEPLPQMSLKARIQNESCSSRQCQSGRIGNASSKNGSSERFAPRLAHLSPWPGLVCGRRPQLLQTQHDQSRCSLRWKPEQVRTGRRGYLGKRGSDLLSSQSRNSEPLLDSMS
jgi:hypothetical protein